MKIALRCIGSHNLARLLEGRLLNVRATQIGLWAKGASWLGARVFFYKRTKIAYSFAEFRGGRTWSQNINVNASAAKTASAGRKDVPASAKATLPSATAHASVANRR